MPQSQAWAASACRPPVPENCAYHRSEWDRTRECLSDAEEPLSWSGGGPSDLLPVDLNEVPFGLVLSRNPAKRYQPRRESRQVLPATRPAQNLLNDRSYLPML